MSGDDRPDRDGGGDDLSDGDPFDDEPSDAVEDPFAALGEGVDEDAEPTGANGSAGDTEASPADPEPAAPADDPFADLDADAAGSPTDEDPFESMGTSDVGDEDVWEALDEGSSIGADATEFDPEAGGELDDAAERSTDPSTGGPAIGGAATGDERVVDKRSYCQRCPHFSAPPETACAHEGTAIVESVDFSRFRVRNCPMVEAEDPAFDGE